MSRDDPDSYDLTPAPPPGVREWAAAQAPLCMIDFQPQCFTAMDDRLRVRRLGALWYGEVRSHLSPVWYVVAEHHQTAQGCIYATLKALGMAHQTPQHDCRKDHDSEPF